METISYSALRENLKACLDKVCADHTPLFVRRRNGEEVVIISRDDYEKMDETEYLLRSPNAARLVESIRNPKIAMEFASVEELEDYFKNKN